MALHVEDGLDIKTKPGTALNSVVRTAHAWKARAEEERTRADAWRARAAVAYALLVPFALLAIAIRYGWLP